jgi:hypothetical protein
VAERLRRIAVAGPNTAKTGWLDCAEIAPARWAQGAHVSMIRPFACADTEASFHSRSVSGLRDTERVARRELLQIHAAAEIASLPIPSRNRSEALRAARKGPRDRV